MSIDYSLDAGEAESFDPLVHFDQNGNLVRTPDDQFILWSFTTPFKVTREFFKNYVLKWHRKYGAHYDYDMDNCSTNERKTDCSYKAETKYLDTPDSNIILEYGLYRLSRIITEIRLATFDEKKDSGFFVYSASVFAKNNKNEEELIFFCGFNSANKIPIMIKEEKLWNFICDKTSYYFLSQEIESAILYPSGIDFGVNIKNWLKN